MKNISSLGLPEQQGIRQAHELFPNNVQKSTNNRPQKRIRIVTRDPIIVSKTFSKCCNSFICMLLSILNCLSNSSSDSPIVLNVGISLKMLFSTISFITDIHEIIQIDMKRRDTMRTLCRVGIAMLIAEAKSTEYFLSYKQKNFGTWNIFVSSISK